MRPFVEEYTLGDGRKLFLLGEGRLVNLAAAEGHPASVMDMSFANQALSLEYLREQPEGHRAVGVYAVPPEIDAEIARLKLIAMGVAHRHAHRRAAALPDLVGERHVEDGTETRAGGKRECRAREEIKP